MLAIQKQNDINWAFGGRQGNSVISAAKFEVRDRLSDEVDFVGLFKDWLYLKMGLGFEDVEITGGSFADRVLAEDWQRYCESLEVTA